jgi:peptidyl-prolyl cis-trans isomerase C
MRRPRVEACAAGTYLDDGRMKSVLPNPAGAAVRLAMRTARPLMTLVPLGVLVLLAGCSRQPATDPDLVARIGSRPIRVGEFQEWMGRRGVGTNVAEKDALLQEMFDHFAAVQKAQELGIDKDPEVRRAWENLLIGKLRERQLEPLLTNAIPSRAQVQARYETNLAAFTEPALRRGAILFAEFPAKAADEQKTQARQRLAEARAKALEQTRRDPAARGFGALAVEYSEDPVTRYRGGDVGWLTEGKGDNRFDPAVVAALFALEQTNAISEVIETPRGCYLVKLLDARSGRVKPLATAQAPLEHKLLVENRQRLEAGWKSQLRSAYPAETFREVLIRIPPPAGQVPAAAEEPPSAR